MTLSLKRTLAWGALALAATGALAWTVGGDQLRHAGRTAPGKGVVDRKPGKLRGTVYGVAPRHALMTVREEAFVGHIDLNTGMFTKTWADPMFAPSDGDTYMYQSGLYRGGILYVPCSDYSRGDEMTVSWRAIELSTGKKLAALRFPSNDPFYDPYSMTYDAVNDMVYGVVLDDQTDSQLVSFDPKDNWKMTYLGNIGQHGNIMALAYNPASETLCAFNCDNQVYAVDPANASMSELGTLDYDEDLFIAGMNGQVVYSPLDELFVFVYRDNDLQENRLLFFDPDTFEVFDGEPFGGRWQAYVANIFTTDPYAKSQAPAQPAPATVMFDGAALSGYLHFKVPAELFNGTKLDKSTKVHTVVTVDGKTVFDENPAAGSVQNLELTLEQGPHEYAIVCDLGGDLVSPRTTVPFHVGNDNPQAVTELAITGPSDPAGATVTWTAPGAVGYHDGYVDTSALTYDVYLDGERQNQAPLTQTSFLLSTDRDLKKSLLEVVASANGVESESARLERIIGRPYTVPFSMEPTRGESALFEIRDCNEDNKTFYYQEQDGQYGMTMVVGYFRDPDDWVFLPVIDFTDNSVAYSLAFEMAGVSTLTSYENLEVMIGSAPEPGAMTGMIYNEKTIELTPEAVPVKANFTVEEAGVHYIGFHLNSQKTQGSKGIVLRNFRIAALDAESGKAPGKAGVEIVPAPKGGRRATVKVTLPETDMVGNPLSDTEEIAVRVQGPAQTLTEYGMPGEEVELEHRVLEDGMASFTLLCSNTHGDGSMEIHRQYVGMDVPFCPTNIRAVPSEDNLSMRITWDAPGEVGVNGGYVDVANLDYPIYVVRAQQFTKVGSTKKTSVTFAPEVPTQAYYYVTVGAESTKGVSKGSEVVRESLGTPYELPMKEFFGTTSFNYLPYNFLSGEQYKNVSFENLASLAPFGINAPIDQGVMACYPSDGFPGMGEILFPKATTKGIGSAAVTLRYWNYESTPEFEIVARRAGNEDELVVLGRCVPTRPLNGAWTEYEVALPQEFLDCGWVQLRLRVHCTGGATEVLAVDSWQLFPQNDIDLKVETVDGPAICSVGDAPNFSVTVVNTGHERAQGTLAVDLVGSEGKVYSTFMTKTGNLQMNQRYTTMVNLPLTGEVAGETELTVRATVDCPDDEVEENNVRSMTFRLSPSALPVVTDLEVRDAGDGNPALSWNTPETQFGGHQDFEILKPFQNGARIGEFQNIDADGGMPAPLASGSLMLEWEGSGDPCGWTLVDTSKIGLDNDPRTMAHSGTNYIMARSNDYEFEYVQASDWLVSPEVKGGTEVRFWYNTLSSTTYEYVELWYSKTDTRIDEEDADWNTSGIMTRCGSFNRLRSFSKNGEAAWEECSFTLPADAKYFALRYCSYDGLAAMIDDLSYTPAENQQWELDHYKVYRLENDGSSWLRAEVDDLGFIDPDFDRYARYYVTTTVKADASIFSRNEGPRSNVVEFGESGTGSLFDGTRGVAGARGQLVANGLAGETLTLSNAAGQRLGVHAIRADRAAIALAPGVYFAEAAGKTYKVIVR